MIHDSLTIKLADFAIKRIKTKTPVDILEWTWTLHELGNVNKKLKFYIVSE